MLNSGKIKPCGKGGRKYERKKREWQIWGWGEPHVYYKNYFRHHCEEVDVSLKLFHLVFNISILCIITSGLRQFLCETISLSLLLSLAFQQNFLNPRQSLLHLLYQYNQSHIALVYLNFLHQLIVQQSYSHSATHSNIYDRGRNRILGFSCNSKNY